MHVEHIPMARFRTSSFGPDFAAYETATGDEFEPAIRSRNAQETACRKPTSRRVPALIAMLGILALTAACGTSIQAPSENETRAPLVSENKPGHAADLKIYGNLHVSRFLGSEGVFNPTPLAVRARRPSSTTAFVQDMPEPTAAIPENVAELGPATPAPPSMPTPPSPTTAPEELADETGRVRDRAISLSRRATRRRTIPQCRRGGTQGSSHRPRTDPVGRSDIQRQPRSLAYSCRV